MTLYRSLGLILVATLALAPATAMAFDDDEMTFDPDDVEWDDDDDDAMTFIPDEVDDEGYDPGATEDEVLDVGIVAVPHDDLTSFDRDEIQEALHSAAREIPGITTYGDRDLLPALVDRDPEYCSRESLCLAGVGRAGGVQRIVQGRVERRPDGYRLDIDYFDVDDRLFVAYHTNEGLGDIDDVLEAIPAGVDDIFGIRRAPEEDEFVDVSEVNALRIGAYFAAGASVVSLGLGTIFGLRVSSAQTELDEAARDGDGNFIDMTQREARAMRRDMESNARTANFGIGAGVGLAALSVALFILSSEDDTVFDEDAEASSGSNFRITPGAGRDGFGVGAMWRF